MIPQCRHGCPEALVLVSLSDGCVCFPDDNLQSLCAQHLARDGFIGDVTMVAEYQPGTLAWLEKVGAW